MEMDYVQEGIILQGRISALLHVLFFISALGLATSLTTTLAQSKRVVATPQPTPTTSTPAPQTINVESPLVPLARVGFVVRDLFLSDKVSVLLERQQ